jgi:hypothetical protein
MQVAPLALNFPAQLQKTDHETNAGWRQTGCGRFHRRQDELKFGHFGDVPIIAAGTFASMLPAPFHAQAGANSLSAFQLRAASAISWDTRGCR